VKLEEKSKLGLNFRITVMDLISPDVTRKLFSSYGVMCVGFVRDGLVGITFSGYTETLGSLLSSSYFDE